MRTKTICTIFCCSFFILYYITIIAIQVDDDKYFTTFYSDACSILYKTSEPTFAVATKKRESPFTFNKVKLTLENCKYKIMFGGKWRIEYRPLVGDHIHLGIAIQIDGKKITMRDRNLTEPIRYEDFRPAETCAHPPIYAYIKQWYHTGVHTHCDNIIHVHPWSAPRKLRVTGKEVTLAMWFESVGISVVGGLIRIPGYEYRKDWVLDYYVNVTDNYPVLRTKNVNEMMNLWLVDHHGFIKLYQENENVPEKDFSVLKYYSKSKLEGNYPSRYIN